MATTRKTGIEFDSHENWGSYCARANIFLAPGTHWRTAKAEAFRRAAAVEEAILKSMPKSDWAVSADCANDHALVVIEVGDRAQLANAVAFLRKVVK